ncbi:uncharacterized protein LACBIDRAFT_317560 [Laccaria bicolor S238N-H82]|uniref:Predicted protein n=1 Tax=Laccaria bicolor (strain S238N-H82 / ATCC MYA-4686) TaxID=486041 RepID=B0E1Y3_LACBS|nr:uncharacterized protein LACBIDRAFT_317560 [Laccaria bicolor S238N-H82]EDQ99135.1 predicted protein [Laccaria bicolor S238N-H82]|eukprot:XP_001890198.1 predicted protein [Laccaria bicolor S238N-H82]
MGENSERKGCGDSWLRRGLHWQDGMAHHDRIVTNRTNYRSLRVLYVVNEGEWRCAKKAAAEEIVCAKWRTRAGAYIMATRRLLEEAFTWTVTRLQRKLTWSLHSTSPSAFG